MRAAVRTIPDALRAPMTPSAHLDPFAREHLPPRDLWPDLLRGEGTAFDYPERLNSAAVLLDAHVEAGRGARTLLHTEAGPWTYRDVQDRADRIAHVLTREMGLVPGNRVLLHTPNTPLAAAAWLGIVKAGGIVVATMPLVRAHELTYTIEKAQVSHAFVHTSVTEALDLARTRTDRLQHVLGFGDGGELNARMAAYDAPFEAVDTAADDPVLIAFTSGTTGLAKATVHAHRDVLAICDAFPQACLAATPSDVFTGSPPLAFTFGLGALLLFPMRIGASAAFPTAPGVDGLLGAIARHGCTVCATSPTAYRAMLPKLDAHDVSSLRACVSAGEALPAATSDAWHAATGLRLIDGIGSTEMLHIFVSAPADAQRPGATGRPLPGYEARVVDEAGQEVPVGTVGLLAVRGPTGCRYLDDEDRQRTYVRDGWNYPGDAYLVDADGYFHYQSRADDMIITGGYNVSGLQVENVLLTHDAVAECGVVGVPDAHRGQIVKAFVVLREGHAASDDLAAALQDFVKAEIAPYKYPRAVAFLDALPRTATGKLQRFRLRDDA